ncbi:MAG: MBL fold metallo-hydrolase [Phycisphaerales bacterium]|nr:MAG: MBL fold metallo-hydrolase [Phycisphaerales bacterium]
MTLRGDTPEEVIVLGSGTSHGVPMIGCDCRVCTSADPRDRRTRTSLFVRTAGVRILIDTSPELRLQCVAHGIKMVDVVLYTHHHADHVVGLDDLRRFNWLMRTHMVVRGTVETLERVRRMFPYAFADDADYPSAKPSLVMEPISDVPFQVGAATVLPIPMMHGKLPVLGFRFGRFAYCTDCNFIPAESLDRLKGLDVLILDALRRRPHPTHFNLEQAVEMAQRIGAERTYFTHIAHELGHEETNADLPDGMALSCDGLTLTFD